MPAYEPFPRLMAGRADFQKPLRLRALYHFDGFRLLFLKHKWFIFRRVNNLFPARNPVHGSVEKPKSVILNRISCLRNIEIICRSQQQSCEALRGRFRNKLQTFNKIRTQADKRNEKPSWLFGDRTSDELKVRIVLLVHFVSTKVLPPSLVYPPLIFKVLWQGHKVEIENVCGK